MEYTCRFCKSKNFLDVLNIGAQPLANSYISKKNFMDLEAYYYLKIVKCNECFLVQSPANIDPNIFFSNYAYLSSFSSSWVQHASSFCDEMITYNKFEKLDFAIEIASNDGYLLQNFLNKNINCLGIEPAKNIAEISKEKGINTWSDFFGFKLSKKITEQYGKANLVIGNNVFAHVPDINDFVKGIENLLTPNGLISLEFPSLEKLLSNNLFDTIYHEHYSYYSLLTVSKIFQKHNLKIVDVKELNTHGGSFRILGSKYKSKWEVHENVDKIKKRELDFGIDKTQCYSNFSHQVEMIKTNSLKFLLDCKDEGKKVHGYGAAAKGNTLLNYLGAQKDLIEIVYDKNPLKQENYLPGSRIIVEKVENIKINKPDFILILPWNLSNEIIEELSFIKSWNGKFVIFFPKLQIVE
jgi:hypothetical protein